MTATRTATVEPSIASGVPSTSVSASAATDQPSPAPTVLNGSATAPVLSYGQGLLQAIEAVHATIELARSQGLSQARIALSPAELGEIRIHLSQGAQGLIARVTADTPAGAQALAEGHAELRQSLHSLGLTALHMDTSASAQAGTQQRDGRAHVPFASTSTSDSRQPASDDGEEDQDAPPAAISDSIATSPGLARGALVDVLA
ncbi:MAG TPA: flagellar hook-length control protein FliK [Solirubrobacteraceae bacterium]|nr:flagellar hook-length control protein FliK [Solirubrobacteraceae bacterium]